MGPRAEQLNLGYGEYSEGMLVGYLARSHLDDVGSHHLKAPEDFVLGGSDPLESHEDGDCAGEAEETLADCQDPDKPRPAKH